MCLITDTGQFLLITQYQPLEDASAMILPVASLFTVRPACPFLEW